MSTRLTAEQVRDAHDRHWHDLPAEYDMPEASALSEYSNDWQAIADELNAALGGGECEVISHYYYDDYDLHEFELSCGHSYTMHDDMPYPFCPICGKKVKAVKR